MKYLLIVNPHSGKKRGLSILNEIKPIFDSNDIMLKIIETTHSGHAKKIAYQINLNNYDGLLAIGGDGTLNEIINGMLNREDGEKTPLGLIPGGSGNSYLHDLKLTEPLIATNAIINNNIQSMDVAKIEVENKIQYSINMIGWGLVTDIGNKAEKYRWLGANRYTILSILEVFTHKSRPATLMIEKETIKDDFTFIIACNSIHVGNGMKMAPKAKLNDGLIDLIVVKSNISRLRLLSTLPKLFDGTHLEQPEVSYYQTPYFSLIPKNNEILNIDGEIMGKTPITVNMIPKAIDFFIGK
jgi:YegS/Rv2252/BmrU family lipid kinase